MMLLSWRTEWKENKFINGARAFFASNYYIALIAVLMTVSELFALELPVYYCYILLSAFALCICDDATPLLPVACCSYMTVSAKNNPGYHGDVSIFGTQSFLIQFAILIGLIAVVMIARLVTAIKEFPENRRMPSLSVGFGVLGLSYVLGGLFSPHYGMQTATYGLLQIISLCALYFYFYYTIDWQKIDKEYLFRIFLCVGFSLAVQIIGMYFQEGVWSENGVERHYLITGWGMYNNVGGMTALCIPIPFYYATTRKGGWRYVLLSGALLVAVSLSQSRGSLLFGCASFVLCAIVTLLKTQGKERRKIFLLLGTLIAVALLALVVLAVCFWDKFEKIFSSMFSDGLNGNGREEIYIGGLKQFLSFPLFGVGFYECPAIPLWEVAENSFFATRYHNTYVQLLASGGLLAFAGYAFHRFQTVRVLLFQPTTQKIYYALSIATFLMISLLDCHFFNFGPGLLYSILLVFIERTEDAPPKRKKYLNR